MISFPWPAIFSIWYFHILLHCRAEYDLFQIELSKNYGVAEWKDDIKGCMKKAGLENTPIVFLFSDTQVNAYTGCFISAS